jgi:adenosylmethionine-8-amino-7-oxononanoate aminotransferase
LGGQGLGEPRPEKRGSRIGLAPRGHVAVADDGRVGEGRVGGPKRTDDRRKDTVLLVGVVRRVAPLELNPDGKIVARLPPGPARASGVPGPLVKRHKLDCRAPPIDQEMGGDTKRAEILAHPGFLGKRLSGEESLRPGRTPDAGRETDSVDDDEFGLRAGGTRVAMARGVPTRVNEPARCDLDPIMVRGTEGERLHREGSLGIHTTVSDRMHGSSYPESPRPEASASGANRRWIERDLAVLWHPCTQMKDHERAIPLVPIARARGPWLYDYEGRRYFDAVASWWVNIFGHAHPTINARVAKQLETLPHVLLAGVAHAPAVELAERLLERAGEGYARCFYADDGSTGIEVALKMAFHWHRNRGDHRRRRFAALEGAYHGETLGALGLGDVALYRRVYAPLLLDPVLIAPPTEDNLGEDDDPEAAVARRLDEARSVFARHGDELAALVVEPLVQCAGGMRMYPPSFLDGLDTLCREYGVLLVADECAVGMGRTGPFLAHHRSAARPDIIVLSKGLTGGYLPLAAVLVTQAVYEAFYDDDPWSRAFLHSHSYTGNPLGCAAALATLDLLDEPGLAAHKERLERALDEAASVLVDHPHVVHVRRTGLIFAATLVQDKRTRRPFPPEERRGLRVFRYGLLHEAWLRPLGNVVYLMPPYVASEEEIRGLVAVLASGVDEATRD